MRLPLGSADIAALLPHRPPFLLLDLVTILDPGKRAVGVKNVTVGEPFLAGHFPGEPIMPGVLIVECLAQLTAVAYASVYMPAEESGVMSRGTPSSHVGYLAAIKDMKFSRLVRPGDQLVLEAVIGASLRSVTNVDVWARVNRELVAEGRLIVSKRPEPLGHGEIHVGANET